MAVGIKYGTVGVLDRDRVLHEVTTFRRDVSTDGRHAVVEYGVSLDDDLARRDFTINAIAYHPLRHEWRDPFSGGQDTRSRIGPGRRQSGATFSPKTISESCGRLRFAARFEFASIRRPGSAARAAAPGLEAALRRAGARRVVQGPADRTVSNQFACSGCSGGRRVWIPELKARTGRQRFPDAAGSDRDPVSVDRPDRAAIQ